MKYSHKLIVLFLLVFVSAFFLMMHHDKTSSVALVDSKPKMPPTTLLAEVSFVSPPPFDRFGIKNLYPTATSGRTWVANWDNSISRTILSGKRDPQDAEFIVRGNGTATIDGNGIAHLSGASPRMYIYDALKQKKWKNVEVTVYAKRVAESGVKSSQGFVVGARSEHQDANDAMPCLGRTYYGRLLYDGRGVFQKEVIHEESYSVNKPSANNKVAWNTASGTLPYDVWVGMKFVVKTNSQGKSVRLKLYRDLTNGKNGGTWENIATYDDVGGWAQINSGVDVKSRCGYNADKILLDPGTSVFIRNDEVSDVQYKNFSIREI